LPATLLTLGLWLQGSVIVFFFCAVFAHKPLHLFFGAVLIARLSKKRLGAPTVWLGAKGTYPICPMLRRRYLAGFLCQGSFVISGRLRGKG